MDEEVVTKSESQDYFTQMQIRLESAFYSFFLFRELSYIIATDIHGTDNARTNAETLGEHHCFFIPVRQSLFEAFVMNAAVFFDKKYDEESDNLRLEFLKSELQKEIAAEKFETVTKDIDRLRNDYGKQIGLLQNCRNKTIAHFPIKEANEKYYIHEFEKLIKGIKEMFQTLSNHRIPSVGIEWIPEEDARNAVKNLFQDLQSDSH